MSSPDSSGRGGLRRPGRPSPAAPGPGRAGRGAGLPGRKADLRGRIRLVAFDLDGTLLGADLTLADPVRRVVAGLRARGVTVLIVTGRMHRTAEGYARELGLEGAPLVSYNGAMVKRVGPAPEATRSAAGRGGDDPWWYRPIATDLAADVVTFLGERGLEPLVFDADRVYAARAGLVAEQYRLISGVDPEYVGDLRARITGSASPAAEGPVRPTKLLQVHSPDLMPALQSEAVERFGDRLSIITSYAFFLEFMDGAVSKGKALAEVCRRLSVRAAQVAAFGDGLNDLDMIQWAGLGVAMGHGPAALLQAADAVAEGPPGEGVARFVEEHLL